MLERLSLEQVDEAGLDSRARIALQDCVDSVWIDPPVPGTDYFELCAGGHQVGLSAFAGPLAQVHVKCDRLRNRKRPIRGNAVLLRYLTGSEATDAGETGRGWRRLVGP